MKVFSLRLPDELYRSYVELAEKERRSLNNQVVYSLEKYLEVIYILESEQKHIEDKKQG